MAGRRRDFDGQFAMFEIGFWFSDPRIMVLSPSAKCFYAYAWMTAVKERREVLPTWYLPLSIGKATGLDPKTTRKVFLTLRENSLLGLTDDKRIIVYGVKRKHPNLTFKNDAINPLIESYNGAQTETETETETEEEGAAQKTAPTATPETQFSEVYQTLRTIDARVYRDLAPNEQLEVILTRESERLGGVGAVVAIAQRFAVWMEDQFQSGAERREKQHRARKRFADWLAREKPNGNGVSGESYTDKILREHRERQTQMAGS